MKRGWAALALLMTSCAGPQSSLDPAGVQASRIHHLWWLFVGISLFVYVAVLAVLAWGSRRRSPSPPTPVIRPDATTERKLKLTVSSAMAFSVALLFLLLFSDFLTGRALHTLSDPVAAKILVVGRQWWWEFRYDDISPSNVLTTANELHLPIGRPVQLELESRDVIHSFWVPNLHGKRDLIPGHTARIFLQADRPDTYWGQCAEYCGYQHANMRFTVTAEPEDDYQKWLVSQRADAAEPTTDQQRRGKQVFLGATCVMCHTIQGTISQAKLGPDLTHVGSRPWIGAGALTNTRANLAGWIANPQRAKPGSRMPPNPLPSENLLALVDYLESLK
ncbi:MAG: cytochrome c oxidase subunit II [Gemmataceae bacterium]